MDTGTLTILFLILIKVLFAAFVIGLVVGGIIYIKDTLLTEEEKAKIKELFTINHAATEKKICDSCGKELKVQWIACPHCGKAVKNEIAFEAEYKSA